MQYSKEGPEERTGAEARLTFLTLKGQRVASMLLQRLRWDGDAKKELGLDDSLANSTLWPWPFLPPFLKGTSDQEMVCSCRDLALGIDLPGRGPARCALCALVLVADGSADEPTSTGMAQLCFQDAIVLSVLGFWASPLLL